MNVQQGADRAEGMPLHTTSGPLGVLRSGGHEFTWQREEWSWPTIPGDPEDAYSYPLDADLDGTVAVERTGQFNDQEFGVDLYRESRHGALTVDAARLWAHALLAAADLADGFNHHTIEEAA